MVELYKDGNIAFKDECDVEVYELTMGNEILVRTAEALVDVRFESYEQIYALVIYKPYVFRRRSNGDVIKKLTFPQNVNLS